MQDVFHRHASKSTTRVNLQSSTIETRGDELQPVQSQVRVDRLDELRLLTDKWRLSAGADNARIGAELLLNAGNHSIHHCDVTVKQSALHACHGRRADHAAWLLNLNSWKFRSMLIERFG